MGWPENISTFLTWSTWGTSARGSPFSWRFMVYRPGGRFYSTRQVVSFCKIPVYCILFNLISFSGQISHSQGKVYVQLDTKIKDEQTGNKVWWFPPPSKKNKIFNHVLFSRSLAWPVLALVLPVVLRLWGRPASRWLGTLSSPSTACTGTRYYA